uniref:Exostosin GT47 domain-containing protein n=1 Tax=viral metagenome TaxID=1070528 RepID=A0A6C0KA83_9ZZZZ
MASCEVHTSGLLTVSYRSVPFQRPVQTEQQAFESIKALDDPVLKNVVYYAISWAAVLDDAENIDIPRVLECLLPYRSKRAVAITSCQHVDYIRLRQVFEYLRVSVVYASHCSVHDSLNAAAPMIRPLPLYACNVENNKRRTGIVAVAPKDKEYLYSFLGMPRCRTDLRRNLLAAWHPPRTLVESSGVWGTVSSGKGIEYNKVMSQSVFTLCPAGISNNTVRIWEALGSGSIPVILADGLVLPAIGLDWSAAVVFVKEKNLSHLGSQLSQFGDEDIVAMYLAGRAIYERCSGLRFASTIPLQLQAEVGLAQLRNSYRVPFLISSVKTIVPPRTSPTDTNTLPVHLIQQHYVPSDPQRAAEVNHCLRVNCENERLDRIHLLNETTETFESEKVLAKNVGARLTYRMAFEYIDSLETECFVALANSDIHFDETLGSLGEMDLRGSRCQALLRWELWDRTLFGPRPDSQDTWIFRHTPGERVVPEKYLAYFDFEMGRPGCDNKLIFLLHLVGFEIFNEPRRIRTWHCHAETKRAYSLEPVKPPYGLVEPQL